MRSEGVLRDSNPGLAVYKAAALQQTSVHRRLQLTAYGTTEIDGLFDGLSFIDGFSMTDLLFEFYPTISDAENKPFAVHQDVLLLHSLEDVVNDGPLEHPLRIPRA